MSQAVTLARPYARAAFSLAQAQGALPKWSGMLGFAAQVAAHPDVQALFGHPRMDAASLARMVMPKGEADAGFERFVGVLAANRRLALLPEIAGLYEQLRAEAERVVKATVTSAVALDADAIARLTASLKRRFGREVEVAIGLHPALVQMRRHRVPDRAAIRIGDPHQQQARRRDFGVDIHRQRALVAFRGIAQLDHLGLGAGDQPCWDIGPCGHRIHVEMRRSVCGIGPHRDAFRAAPDIEHVAIAERMAGAIHLDPARAAEIGDPHFAGVKEERGADIGPVAEG